MELAVVFVLYKFWTKLSHTTCPIQHYSPIRMVCNNPVCKTRIHCEYQIKPHSLLWFLSACVAAIANRNHFLDPWLWPRRSYELGSVHLFFHPSILLSESWKI